MAFLDGNIPSVISVMSKVSPDELLPHIMKNLFTGLCDLVAYVISASIKMI